MQTELEKNGRPSGYVLVVDDEEANRTLLKDPLEALGYEVAEAEDGHQALELVAKRSPDAILLDVMMPQLDGFEVCRRLKQNEQTAPIPILMVTALSERKERLMGIEAGANDFLSKPVDMQDVTLRVGNAVYTKHLFDQLGAEQQKSERLLLNILPQPIAERMKVGEVNIADRHADATVLVADLVGFTALAAHVNPDQVVCLLNEIFSAFDLLADRYGLEKIKTIGDAYMVAGGIPRARPDHATAVAEMALGLRDEIARFNEQYYTSIHIRMGISSGPIIAGVIGSRKFAYDLWGDTVNLAFDLQAAGEPDEILVAEATYGRLKHVFSFDWKPKLVCKGHGQIDAYALYGRI